MFAEFLGEIANRVVYPLVPSRKRMPSAPTSLASTARLSGFRKYGAASTGSLFRIALNLLKAYPYKFYAFFKRFVK